MERARLNREPPEPAETEASASSILIGKRPLSSIMDIACRRVLASTVPETFS